MLEKKLEQKIVSIAKEDINGKDITSALLKETKITAQIISSQNGVISGIEEIKFLFTHFGVKTVHSIKDGEKINNGQIVMKLSGSNKKILSLERTALNILGRMSGVATLCKKASQISKNKTKIFLTRKTMPGFGLFDKKACLSGGVFSHRKNLNESILIKENHLKFESIPILLEKASLKKTNFNAREIEIEVENQLQAIIAAKNNAGVIMLDNFSPKKAIKGIFAIRDINKRIIIELSGGINLFNLKQYVNLGADRISMGALTKDAKMIDFSLEII